MERPPLKSRRFSFWILAAILVGCASFPRSREQGEWWGLLPDAPIMLYGKMAPIRQSLLSRWNDQPELHEVLKRTTDFYGAVYLGRIEQERRYSVLLLGDFPRGLTGLSLGWNPSWRHQAGNPEQWIHTRQALAVTLPEDGVILARNLPWEPREIQSNRRQVPLELTFRSQQFDLFLLVDQPLSYFLGEAGSRIPVEHLVMPLNFQEDGWVGSLELRLKDERQVRALAGLLRLTRNLWVEELLKLGILIDRDSLEIKTEEAQVLIGPLKVPLALVDNLLDRGGSEP